MATITKTLSLSYTAGNDLLTALASLAVEQVGVGFLFAPQIIGTASETLAFGDLANLAGGLLLKNTDATNYVEIDSANTYDKFPQKILPGQAVFLSPQTLVLHARANTAPVTLQVTAVAL